jgi:hypothetical protein
MYSLQYMLSGGAAVDGFVHAYDGDGLQERLEKRLGARVTVSSACVAPGQLWFQSVLPAGATMASYEAKQLEFAATLPSGIDMLIAGLSTAHYHHDADDAQGDMLAVQCGPAARRAWHLYGISSMEVARQFFPAFYSDQERAAVAAAALLEHLEQRNPFA